MWSLYLFIFRTVKTMENPRKNPCATVSFRSRGAFASESVTHLTGLGVLMGRARRPCPGIFRRRGGSPFTPYAVGTPRPRRGLAAPSPYPLFPHSPSFSCTRSKFSASWNSRTFPIQIIHRATDWAGPSVAVATSRSRRVRKWPPISSLRPRRWVVR